MPSPSAILFPFRRLAVWLGILVLAVAGVALAISALVVLPSLEHNLVAQRVQAVARQARESAPIFEPTLLGSPGRVFSRSQLLDSVWGSSDFREPRTVDVHIRHLREKIEHEPSEPELLLTVRGVGYRFAG